MRSKFLERVKGDVMQKTDSKYNSEKINRYALVTRNSPVLEAPDTKAPLTVGNGEFAFTADITGLQTFYEQYEYFPLCTMAQWGWHSFPVERDYSKLRLKQYENHGRLVGYAADDAGQEQLFKNLRENPHRLNLCNIKLNLKENNRTAVLSDIKNARQKLDLWQGILQSDFMVFNESVRVETCADPEIDAVSACVGSNLARSGRLEVVFAFPYGSPEKKASDWEREEAHKSEIVHSSSGRVIIKRTLDRDEYYVDIVFSSHAGIEQTGCHQFTLSPAENTGEICFTASFSAQMPANMPGDFHETKSRSSTHWEKFWSSGGAVQLVNSSDSRAAELERRIVLSQYLTAVQCSGTTPPAETGLTCNSWYGKFHLEMHYWHAAQFTLWGRPQLLERSLDWYLKILPQAGKDAENQGYEGARWTKMSDPSGLNAPSSIGVLLVWQQPHPIMLSELCYRARPEMETLKKYRSLVMESADFMVSFLHYDNETGRYVMGPPLIPAQETHAPEDTMNPAYELEYFRWGLKTAVEWQLRLGEKPNSRYLDAAAKLSALPAKDGVYLAHENCPETFTKAPFNHDHPSMLAALGVLPGETVDRGIMENTLRRVLECWDFDSMWGWDFAMMAMCCARLGLTSLAVDLLLADKPKNTYALNGHNSQADREDLPLYLPGNGSLLLAVAIMAAGWEGDGGKPLPGFPDDGSWCVEAEGLLKYI